MTAMMPGGVLKELILAMSLAETHSGFQSASTDTRDSAYTAQTFQPLDIASATPLCPSTTNFRSSQRVFLSRRVRTTIISFFVGMFPGVWTSARWALMAALTMGASIPLFAANLAKGDSTDFTPLVWEVDWAWENGTDGDGLSLQELKDRLSGGLVLRPPERWLGIPFRHDWSRLNGRWIRALKDGQPVPTGTANVFDGLAMERSAALMRSRMIRAGYLESRLRLDTATIRPGKLRLDVILSPGPRYFCASTRVQCEKSGLDPGEVERLAQAWSQWEGKPLDLNDLEEERERIARDFAQRGWFGLISDFISIAVDTSDSQTTHGVHLVLEVAPIIQSGDTLPHRKAYLDSISFHWHPKDGDFMKKWQEKGVWWRMPENRTVKGLAHRLHLETGKLYNPLDISSARQSIRMFPLIEDVRVDIAPRFDKKSSDLPLHVHFDAYPSERRVMKVNGALTSRQGLGGEMAVSLSDQDFRQRMERLALDVSLGRETVVPFYATGDRGGQNLLNSRVVSAGVTYSAHRLIPFASDRFPESNRPESSLTFSLRDEKRDDFTRTYVQLGLVERFIENQETGSHVEMRLFEVAVTSSQLFDEFQEALDSLGSDIFASSFEPRALLSSGIHWKLRPSKNRTKTWMWAMDVGFEGAGNLFHLLDARSPESTTVPLPSILDATREVQVARYTRWVFEGRGGWTPNGRDGIFARLTAGVAASSIDGVSVPLEKQFYVGGPNSMRGWQAMGLGPGGTGQDGLRGRGDIRLEFNLEARKYVNEWIQLAAFSDAGNVWMTRPETERPHVEFNRDRFLEQVGWAAGAGLRLDFGYFLVRFDAGYPLISPSGEFPTGRRWRIHPAVSLPF